MSLRTIVLNPFGDGQTLLPHEVDDLAAGRARLRIPRTSDFEHPRMMRLSARKLDELNQVRKRGWFYASNGSRDNLQILAHYLLEGDRGYWCSVSRRGKTASVVLDAILLGSSITDRWSEQWSALKDLRADVNAAEVSLGVMTTITGVPRERAEECATRLVALFDDVAGGEAARCGGSRRSRI